MMPTRTFLLPMNTSTGARNSGVAWRSSRPVAGSVLRTKLDHGFEAQGPQPRIVAGFEDTALPAVFAARGLGVFPVSQPGAEDVGLLGGGLRWLGTGKGVKEEFHALGSRWGQHHPWGRSCWALRVPEGV